MSGGRFSGFVYTLERYTVAGVGRQGKENHVCVEMKWRSYCSIKWSCLLIL